MSRKINILSAIFLLSFSFFIFGGAKQVSAAENTICKGVFIDAVDVSGMTKQEAQSAIDSFIEELRSKGVAVTFGKDVVYTTMGDLGYSYDDNDNIDKALGFGKSGNLIKRYKELKDIEQGNVVLPLTFTIDDKKLKDFITEKVSKYNIAPVNAKVSRKNGEFIYTDHVVGTKVDVDQTAAEIENIITNNWNRSDILVDAVTEEDLPIYTKDVVEKCNTILGQFTTQYADSAEGRAANLANGARLINNTLLYPGDVFSAYEHLTPFTIDNGYYVAGAYLQGKVIDSIGGGACQVTTTLYNAVLNAELEVVERQPHSMTISYVDLSRDAAIAGTYKDFKFKNNTDVPILIEAHTQGRKITFTLWGNETRDTKNRKVKYETVVLAEIKPPADVITKDPTQPTTYRKVTQSAHTGYRAELYKVVYENGVETSRELVNKSSYSAAPRYITIGTKVIKKEPDKPKPDDTKPVDKNPGDADSQTDAQTIGQGNTTNPDDQVQGDIYWDSPEDNDNSSDQSAEEAEDEPLN